jgi:hypothetical protein
MKIVQASGLYAGFLRLLLPRPGHNNSLIQTDL